MWEGTGLKIAFYEPYKWFGEYLPGGAALEVGRMYNGHVLRATNAERFVAMGIAEVVE